MQKTIVFAFAIVLVNCQVVADDLFFESSVQAIFENKCNSCHNAKDLEGDLDLTSPASIQKGGENGQVIFDVDRDKSPLLQKILSKNMPPADAKPLTETELNKIKRWVNGGAKFKSGQGTVVTAERIIPLLHLRCVKCHGAEKQEAGLDLRTVDSLLKGSKNGKVIVAGNASKSLIIQKIVSEEMPPRKRIVPDSVKTMTKSELKILTEWIDKGMVRAPHRTYEKATVDSELEFWSFKSPKKSKLPNIRTDGQVFNPVDRFLLFRLEKNGLRFSPIASKRTLIRRLFFDLIGLPPSPEEIQRFVEDASPDAFESLVDRLLLSPEFGEKWAAHWLDAVGYADSEGGQNEDRVRAYMWHYRDYVIRSYRRDKSFKLFLTEQLAGDELYDYENEKTVITEPIYEALAATGFLRTTPDRTFQNITNFVPDRLDVIADEIQVLGSSVLGMTINCARCHAHKFDPIPQEDYYRLSAVFKDALDEHDWLKPEHRVLKIPVSRLGADVPRDVKKAAHEKNIFLRALWSRGRPSPTYLLHRGNPLTPGIKLNPQVPEWTTVSMGSDSYHVKSIDHKTRKSGRRLAFAKWATSENNPLTSRVYVNRIWKHVFGNGMVASLDNFGKTGTRPTHPELLDWLAVEFIQQEWSTKRLLRLLVTSRAYRQSSIISEDAREMDPGNRLISRMPLKRLAAESVRDSILQVTGQMSSVKHGPPGQIEEKENGLVLSKELASGGWSRSIYVIHRRSKIPTIMESFDYPQMGPNCIVRKNSIVPQQALHLTNNSLVKSWCDSHARSLVREFGRDFSTIASRFVESACGRQPKDSELIEFESYFQMVKRRWSIELGKDANPDDVFAKALGTFCHTIINAAPFIYID